MKTIKYISLALVIVGALNWGLIGLFNFNLVSFLFGTNTFLETLVYILVGLSGILSLAIFPSINNIRD